MGGEGHDRALEELLRALDEATVEGEGTTGGGTTGAAGGGAQVDAAGARRLHRELLGLLADALEPRAAAAGPPPPPARRRPRRSLIGREPNPATSPATSAAGWGGSRCGWAGRGPGRRGGR